MRLEMKFVSKSEKIEAFTRCFYSVFPKTKIVSESYRNFGKKSQRICVNFFIISSLFIHGYGQLKMMSALVHNIHTVITKRLCIEKLP